MSKSKSLLSYSKQKLKLKSKSKSNTKNQIQKFIKLILNKKFDNIINYLLICPLLYLIQYDWEKYKIIALVIGVFIFIKNILVINFLNLLYKKKFSIVLLFKFIKMILGILFFALQYKKKFIADWNIWITNILYFNYVIKFLRSFLKSDNILT